MGICSRRLLALLTVLVVGLFAPISTTWARPSLQEAAYTIVEFGVPTASGRSTGTSKHPGWRGAGR